MADRERGVVGEAGGDGWIDWRPMIEKHKALVLVVLLASLASAYVTVQFVLTELYEGKASVLVKVGRENTEIPATVLKGSVVSAGVRREALNSELQMLTSPALIAALVDRLGPAAFAPPPRSSEDGWSLRETVRQAVAWVRGSVESLLIAVGLEKRLTDRERAIPALERALRVDVMPESQVIAVTLRLPDPDLAVRTLEILLQMYLDNHIQVWRSIDAREFFDTQVISRRRQVGELEAAREAVKARWNLVATSEQRTLLLRQLDIVGSEIEGNNAKMAALRAQERTIRDRLDALPEQLRQNESITPNPLVQARKEKLIVLELERARRLTVYERESPPIKNIEREVADLNELLAKEAATVVASVTLQANPLRREFEQTIEQMRVQMEGLEASTKQLQARAARLAERLREINGGEQQLRELDREYQIAEERYLAYAKRTEEGRISEELDRARVTNVALLSPPVRPVRPIFPRKLLIMVLSAPVGLLLGIMSALLVEYVRPVVASPRDLAGLQGVTYLGSARL